MVSYSSSFSSSEAGERQCPGNFNAAADGVNISADTKKSFCIQVSTWALLQSFYCTRRKGDIIRLSLLPSPTAGDWLDRGRPPRSVWRTNKQ